MEILELLNELSMDLVTSLCDYSSKQDIKQKNMKYKRLQFSLPSITFDQYGWILATLLLTCCR